MQPEQIIGQKVLYGCLDWGNGHLARSISLLLQLERQGNEVFFCGSEMQRYILRQYGFVGSLLDLPETGFRFKGDGNFPKEGVRNLLALRNAIRRDCRKADEYVRQYGIDLVISDHRYGLRSDQVPSVFITHQVKLPAGTHAFAQHLHQKWMQRFTIVWIMDTATERLAGELSDPCTNGYYIGRHSRFSGLLSDTSGGHVAIISGPEPYAEQFYDLVIDHARTRGGNWTVICPGTYGDTRDLPNVRIIRNDWRRADEAIRKAKLIVSRNGYSTLMDLEALNKPAILVPTPGQTEQQYLAKINPRSDWKTVNQL